MEPLLQDLRLFAAAIRRSWRFLALALALALAGAFAAHRGVLWLRANDFGPDDIVEPIRDLFSPPPPRREPPPLPPLIPPPAPKPAPPPAEATQAASEPPAEATPAEATPAESAEERRLTILFGDGQSLRLRGPQPDAEKISGGDEGDWMHVTYGQLAQGGGGSDRYQFGPKPASGASASDTIIEDSGGADDWIELRYPWKREDLEIKRDGEDLTIATPRGPIRIKGHYAAGGATRVEWISLEQDRWRLPAE